MTDKKSNGCFTVIDLFCGAGGLSYGFSEEEYKVMLGIDNDSAALKTFQKNHHDSKIINKDVTKVSKSKIAKIIGKKKVDVIIGGPPCQGFSLSGPRKFNDPRNRLYVSFINYVDCFRPKAFIIENVPGLISLYKGQIKDRIIYEFEKIGYKVTYKILNAAEFGVPQLRKRVVFVGLRKHFFDFPVPKLHEKDFVTCKDALSDLPSLIDGLGTDPAVYNTKPSNIYQKRSRSKSENIRNHIGTNHSEQTRKVISMVPEGGNYKNLPDSYRNVRNFHVAFTRYDSKKPALTVDTGHRHHFHYKYNRVLTVRENARVQSFPDTFVFYGNKSEQYRQAGNAVPPILAKAIARKLKEYL
ncbi:modification methylase BspRI [bacterium BMS3Abin10]|nr:modification methylase BspRI [bacterium BMS3Abin10]GBE39535.1 modification methylase BspRI [bacterium BMS3Bbin08]